MTPPKIFISATSGDLSSARQIAKEALLTINCHPVEQTNFEPDWRSVTDMLRGKIGDCQALIHLAGYRYGAEPDLATLPPGTPRRSYTQMEYHLAHELGLRVYTFLLPETYTFDVPAKTDTPEQTHLQAAHRALIQSSPHLYEKPANDLDLRTRLIALQEKVIHLEQEQQSIAMEVTTTRHWGLWATAAILLILGGIGYWQWQVRKLIAPMAQSQDRQAAQMAKMSEALSRIQQQTDPAKDPISQWPQDRLEEELSRQMRLSVTDLRALLQAGRTSLDTLVKGQSLLAFGKHSEAGEKFDQVLQQEAASAQRMKQAWEGKAQIAYDKVRYTEALDYRQKAAALVDKATDPVAWAEAQGHVAFTHYPIGHHKEAETLLQEVLRLREQHLGPAAIETAYTLNDLGQLFQATNRLAEAEPLMQRVVTIFENSGGEFQSIYYAGALNNLAQLFKATKRLSKAEQMTERAVGILFNSQARIGNLKRMLVTVVGNYVHLAREVKMSYRDIHSRLDKLRQEAELEVAAFDDIWRAVLMVNCVEYFQVVITEVVKGGQAEALGLQAGDAFVSYNEEAITSTNQLIHLSDESNSEAIPLKVLRGGQVLTFTARSGKLGTAIVDRPMPLATRETHTK